MRPSLTKSKSGSHLSLSLSLPSPLPCSLVSFSNNKRPPLASFGQVPEPWAVSWTLGGLPWPGCLPLYFLLLLFFFFFFEFAALLWRVLFLSLSESQSCLPAKFRTRDTCGPLVWSLKRRGLPDLPCPSSDSWASIWGRVWMMLGHVWSTHVTCTNTDLFVELMCKSAAGLLPTLLWLDGMMSVKDLLVLFLITSLMWTIFICSGAINYISSCTFFILVPWVRGWK